MDRPTSIPQHIWDSFSGEARAIVGTVIDGLERQIIELRQQVQDLKARLDQNSTNSSKPPSTDPIGVKRKPPEPPSTELPPIEPEVHEYRLHRLCCPHCQAVSGGALPGGVPRISFGPRLHAALGV